MSEHIQGMIVNYHVGVRTQKSKECLIDFSQARPISEVGRLIGRKVVWKFGKKAILGKSISFHGRKGIVLVRFRKGLPGQAIGTTVDML